MSFRFGSILLSVLASLLLLAPAHAAQVTFANGDQITGRIIKLTEGTIFFESPILGLLKVPFDQVAKLMSDANARISLEDGTELLGELSIEQNGGLSVRSKDGQITSQGLVREQLLAINKPAKDATTKYSGRANLGGLFNRGNSVEDTLNLDAEWVARAIDNRFTVGLEVNEGSSASVTTTSNRLLSAKYDLFLSDENYVFVTVKGENDDLADLKLRSTFGGGYGRQFWETDITQLSAEAGLSYINEDYELGEDQSFPSMSLGLNYDRKLFDNALVLFNKSSLNVSLENNEDALFKNKLGLRFPLAGGVNLSTQLNVDYDNMPAAGAKKTDTSLIFSVGYGY